MSASRERKKRLEQVNEPVAQVKKKKKISEGWIFAISIVLVVALVFGGIFAYGVWKRHQTVLTVGEHEIDAMEFNYFYNATATNFFSYASYLGFDTTTPLDQQQITEENLTYLGLVLNTTYLADFTPVNGTYDVTLAHLIADNAKDMAVEAYTIYDAAVAAGYELDADCLAEIEAEMTSLQEYAESQGYSSVDELLNNVYGTGCDEEGYREYLEVVHVAQHYPSEIRYGEDELAARYDESPETFDAASFYLYSTSASDYVEAAEDGTTPDPTEAEEEKAKTAAEDMANSFNEESEDIQLYTDYTHASVTNLCGEEAAEWLFNEANADGAAVKLFIHNETYYVLKLIDKENYNTINVLQVYIADDAADTELAVGELSAEEKIAAVTAGLESDASKENFQALAEQYSEEGSEIVVDGLTRADMTGVSEDAYIWAYTQERAEGDWQVFEVTDGTIILMITGYGDSYRNTVVNETMVSEWITEATNAASAACGYDEKAAMSANVGLVYTGA